MVNYTPLNIFLLYSAKKKNAKDIDEYSVKWPDTYSDSASNKSNGDLPNSAVKLMANMIDIGYNAIINLFPPSYYSA